MDIFNRTVAPVGGSLPALDALLLRQLQGPRGRAAPIRADVSRVPRPPGRRDPCRDGEPRVRRARGDRRDRGAADVAVGIIDVKSYYIETPEDVAEARAALPAARAGGKAVFAPDCGLSQTARWAAKQKLANMVRGRRASAREMAVKEPWLPTTRCSPTSRAAATRLRLWWLGQSGFLLKHDGPHLLLDPYLSRFADAEIREHRQAARAHEPSGWSRRSAWTSSTSSRPAQSHQPSRRRDADAHPRPAG